MSDFDVTFETIKEIRAIEGADLIEAATLADKDFWFVVAKGSFKTGQQCVYFPIDSILPDDLILKLGLVGKLAGKQHNRVKTKKLRGQVSQGIVADPEVLGVSMNSSRPLHLTLGVTKYEPPEVLEKTCRLVSLPDGMSKYDIESVDRHPIEALELFKQPVWVSEKLEGTNVGLLVEADKDRLCTRLHEIVEIEGFQHTHWKTARRGLLDLGHEIRSVLGQDVILYGELIGPKIQGNIYGLSEHRILLYDIKMRYGGYLGVEEFMALVPEDFRVPVLFEGDLVLWTGQMNFDPKILKVMSDGESKLTAGVAREGIVIKPLVETASPYIGRLILKQRGPLYLAGE